MAGIGNAFDRKDPETAIAMIQTKMKELNSGAIAEDNTSDFLDMFYPVGSYYETSDGNFNPNVKWGGTWELESGGNVHIGAGGNYSIGGTGGAETVTLTSAQSGMPSHGHDYTSPTVLDSGQLTAESSGSHAHGAGYDSNNNAYHFLGYNFGATGNGAQERSVAAGASGDYKAPVVNNANVDFLHIGETVGAGSHQHTIASHGHSLSGGGVGNVSAQNASSAHNNMQPYIVVNRWHRTA